MRDRFRFVLKRSSDGRYFRSVPSHNIEEEWTTEIDLAQRWFDIDVVCQLAERWNNIQADQLVIEGFCCDR